MTTLTLLTSSTSSFSRDTRPHFAVTGNRAPVHGNTSTGWNMLGFWHAVRPGVARWQRLSLPSHPSSSNASNSFDMISKPCQSIIVVSIDSVECDDLISAIK